MIMVDPFHISSSSKFTPFVFVYKNENVMGETEVVSSIDINSYNFLLDFGENFP